MRWDVHGQRWLYESPWVGLALVDVEPPGGERFEHHVVRFPQPAVGAVVHDPARGVLLLWRHRFTVDAWGWELPAGRAEAGEPLEVAAAREVEEETGWRPGPLRPLASWHPASGSTDLRFHAFVGEGAVEVGPPVDRHEAERVAWVPVEEVRSLVRSGQVLEGLSLTALALWLGGLAG